MKEQTVVITKEEEDINAFLKEGWMVISVTPQRTSTGGSSQLWGYFLVVLEKQKV